MPTIKTIKPAGGGDYTTLALWEDYADGQSSADQWAECYTGGDLGPVNLDSASWPNSTSSSYPKVYAADGHSHYGSILSGAYISSTGSLPPFQTTVEHTRLEGIRMVSTVDTYKAARFSNSSSGLGCRIEKCLIHGSFQYGIWIGQSGGSGVESGNYIVNNIVIINGQQTNDPAGIYVFGTDGSGGTTNVYAWHNAIYVSNSDSKTNIGFQFTNISGCILNPTVENNVIIGGNPSYHTSYKQVAFSSGTKIFNNNISSDLTSDDFGGSDNQISKTASEVWDDAENNVFSISKTSIAYDSGKTLPLVTEDALGKSRPQGDYYDIGPIERAQETAEPSAAPTSRLEIPDNVITSYNYVIDGVMESSIAQECKLIYPVTKNSSCPNCIYSPREKKSSNIYKNGGPIPFPNHTICPWCGGAGKSNRAIEESIRLRVYWSPKDWSIANPVENPDTSVMVIGYLKDLPNLEKADRILLNKNIASYRSWLCERAGESVPWGLGQNKYFAQMLRRVGGG
jgi:hypothetical protein